MDLMTRRRALLNAKPEEDYWDYKWMTPDLIRDAQTGVGIFACKKVPVRAGKQVTIEVYYATDPSTNTAHGYIYDGRAVGLQYYGNVMYGRYPVPDSDINVPSTIVITPTADGELTLCTYNIYDAGDISKPSSDNMSGKYIRVHLEK